MKTVQQRGIDASDAARRYHDLNHVVLAEINFFQKQKVIDLNQYLSEVVDEQTNFYGEVNECLPKAFPFIHSFTQFNK